MEGVDLVFELGLAVWSARLERDLARELATSAGFSLSHVVLDR